MSLIFEWRIYLSYLIWSSDPPSLSTQYHQWPPHPPPHPPPTTLPHHCLVFYRSLNQISDQSSRYCRSSVDDGGDGGAPSQENVSHAGWDGSCPAPAHGNSVVESFQLTIDNLISSPRHWNTFNRKHFWRCFWSSCRSLYSVVVETEIEIFLWHWSAQWEYFGSFEVGDQRLMWMFSSLTVVYVLSRVSHKNSQHDQSDEWH